MEIEPEVLFQSPGTGRGPGLDSGAAEWSPHQSTRSSPRAATTEEVDGNNRTSTDSFFTFLIQ